MNLPSFRLRTLLVSIALGLVLVLTSGEFWLTSESDGVRFNQLIALSLYLVAPIHFLLRPGRLVQLLRARPAAAVMLVLLALGALSAIWSSDPISSYIRLLSILLAALFGFYVAISISPSSFLRCLIFACGIALVVSLLAISLYPSEAIMTGYHEGSWRGIYNQKNGLARIAVLAVMASVLGLHLIRPKLISLFVLMLGALVLAFTGSTTGLVVGATLVGLYMAKGLLQTRTLTVAATITFMLPLILIITGVIVFSFDNIVALLGRDITMTGRLPIWQHSFEEGMNRFVAGSGLGGFWNGWDSPAAHVWRAVGWQPSDSHNGFLDLFLELGLFGLLLFAALCLTIFVSNIRWLMYPNRNQQALLPLFLLLYILLYNISESAILRPTNILFILLAYAAAVDVNDFARRKTDRRTGVELQSAS